MWGILRIVLLIGNAALFAFWGYVVTTDHNSHEWWEYLIIYAIGTCLALNVAYLWLNKDPSWPRLSDWRIFRLIGLWFDAKESELRQRAKEPRQ